jgi:hypothetical protein
MILDSPHTSTPMLMRGNTPPTMRSPPHRSRPAGYPTDNPPLSARKNGEGEARRRGGRRRGWPPSICAADPHQHHPPPNRQDTVHIAHFYKRPTLAETRTQSATGINRRTPTTRCHIDWAFPGRRTQTDARESPSVVGHPQKGEHRTAPWHGEGGHRRRRTAALRHAAGGGPRDVQSSATGHSND